MNHLFSPCPSSQNIRYVSDSSNISSMLKICSSPPKRSVRSSLHSYDHYDKIYNIRMKVADDDEYTDNDDDDDEDGLMSSIPIALRQSRHSFASSDCCVVASPPNRGRNNSFDSSDCHYNMDVEENSTASGKSSTWVDMTIILSTNAVVRKPHSRRNDAFDSSHDNGTMDESSIFSGKSSKLVEHKWLRREHATIMIPLSTNNNPYHNKDDASIQCASQSTESLPANISLIGMVITIHNMEHKNHQMATPRKASPRRFRTR